MNNKQIDNSSDQEKNCTVKTLSIFNLAFGLKTQKCTDYYPYYSFLEVVLQDMTFNACHKHIFILSFNWIFSMTFNN